MRNNALVNHFPPTPFSPNRSPIYGEARSFSQPGSGTAERCRREIVMFSGGLFTPAADGSQRQVSPHSRGGWKTCSSTGWHPRTSSSGPVSRQRLGRRTQSSPAQRHPADSVTSVFGSLWPVNKHGPGCCASTHVCAATSDAPGASVRALVTSAQTARGTRMRRASWGSSPMSGLLSAMMISSEGTQFSLDFLIVQIHHWHLHLAQCIAKPHLVPSRQFRRFAQESWPTSNRRTAS